jgi:hypothetical protein
VINKLTRTLLLAACGAAISMLPLSATTTPPACVDGASLASYEALSGGCTVGDLLFSNFSDIESASGGGAALTAAGITVDTLGPAGSGASFVNPNDGLSFGAGWDASAGEVVDSTIFFTVSLVTGATAEISDAGLAQLAGAAGTGSASVIEDGCTSSPSCNPTNNPWALLTVNSSDYTATSDSGPLGPSTFTNVAKDISVSGGTSGYAALSLVEDTFSQIPEPRALALMLGLGLLAGGIFRKKLQSVRG